MADNFRNLVVNLYFNPPELIILGSGIQPATVETLHALLPQSSDSSPGQKATGTKTYSDSPLPHWHLTYPNANCSEGVGQTNWMLRMLECLDDEGQWKLKGSNALNVSHVNLHGKMSENQQYKFFFTKKAR